MSDQKLKGNRFVSPLIRGISKTGDYFVRKYGISCYGDRWLWLKFYKVVTSKTGKKSLIITKKFCQTRKVNFGTKELSMLENLKKGLLRQEQGLSSQQNEETLA